MSQQLEHVKAVYEHNTEEVNLMITNMATNYIDTVLSKITTDRTDLCRRFAGDDDMFVPFSYGANPQSEAYAEFTAEHGNEEDECCYIADIWAYVLLRASNADIHRCQYFTELALAYLDINVNGL